MTQVEFYSLKDGQQKPFAHMVGVVRDAYRKGLQVFIHTQDKRSAETIDEILWTEDAKSFLPHQLVNEDPATIPPIEIGFGQKPGIRPDLLVNLADEVPDFFSRFNTVVEYAWGDEAQKEKARARFRFYKANGYPLRHQQI